MKNFTKLFMLCTLILISISCGSDESQDCNGLLNNGGTMQIDSESLNTTIAQLLISSGFEGDRYLFQIGGLSDDCNELRTLSFVSEITANSAFDGNYDIVHFFSAELNDVTSMTITTSNIGSGQQSQIEINSGTMTVKKLADREYEVDMTGNLVGGGTIEIAFKSVF